MASILTNIIEDPKRLEALSSFLLGFGQSAAVAGQRGFSTLGGVGVGFGAAGQSLTDTMLRQQFMDLRQQEIEQREQKLAQEEGTKRALQSSFSTEVIDPGVAGAPRAQAAQQAAVARAGGAPLLQNVASNIAAEGGDPRLASSFLSSAIGQQAQQQRFEQGIGAQKEAATTAFGRQKELAGIKAGLREPKSVPLTSLGKEEARLNALLNARQKAITNNQDVTRIDEQIRNVDQNIERIKTGTQRTVQGVPKQLETRITQQNKAIDDLVAQAPGMREALESVGLAAEAKDLGINILGQIPGGVGAVFRTEPFRKVIRDKTTISLFKQELKLALAKNPRIPVAEQKQIVGLIKEGGFKSTAAAEEAFTEVFTRLQNIRSRNDEFIATFGSEQPAATARSSGRAPRRVRVNAGGAPIQ